MGVGGLMAVGDVSNVVREEASGGREYEMWCVISNTHESLRSYLNFRVCTLDSGVTREQIQNANREDYAINGLSIVVLSFWPPSQRW